MKHFSNLLSLIRNKGYKTGQLRTFTFWSIIFNCRKLRSDYKEITSKRYAENVRLSISNGYYPSDWNHTSEEFWLKVLEC